MKRLRDRWDRDLTPDGLMIEKENVTVFDAFNGNSVMNMLKYISENYEGDERTYIDKDGDEIVSSYRLLLVAHNSSGFDSWILLNSLVEGITDLKIIKTARGLISLSFRCGIKIVEYRRIELQKIYKCDSLVSYDFNSLYPSAQIDINRIWHKIETAYLLEKYMSDAVCSLFDSARWNELNRSAFLTVKYHNPENLVFQHLPIKGKIENPYKNNRLEEINRMKNGITIDTLTSVDVVEIVKYGGLILEVFEGFFCHNQEYNPYTEFVRDMFEKRDLFKSQGRDLLQNLPKKIWLSGYGGNIRKDINQEYKCVTENWMREIFDDRVREWFPLRNGNLIVKLEDDEGVDDYDKARSINTMPSHFGSYILSHSKRLMNDVIKRISGFYNNSIYYTGTDSLYTQKILVWLGW